MVPITLLRNQILWTPSASRTFSIRTLTKYNRPVPGLVILWTHGESHPGLVHAMDVCYCYTMGPITSFGR